MAKFKIIHIVGARPNFMKLAPVYKAFEKYQDVEQVIIHTGQHYDHNMSDVFFEQLEVPAAHVNLNISGKSVLQQIGHGILKLEETLPLHKPDIVIIYGDINATAYAAIVCSKTGITLAHVEAGLRSYDRQMPEETNRIIADSLSDLYFTPSRDANENLLKEGIANDKIFFVGNVMIDTLTKFLPIADKTPLGFELPAEYGLITLHRPSNVDDENNLLSIISVLEEIGNNGPLIFPIHPRTRSKLELLTIETNNIKFVEPQGYLSFLKLQKNAKFVITDSGGVQEETTYLGIPCFTLRNNTERPITVDDGSNVLVGASPEKLLMEMNSFFRKGAKYSKVPELWDGDAANRIAKIIYQFLLNRD